jgi:adenylosuccinate lyase
MKKNLDKTRGLVFSQSVLLALTKKGMKREDAYKVVQDHAMKVWEDGASSFEKKVIEDGEITKFLNKKELEEIFDLKKNVKHVDAVFKRLGLG